MTGPAQPEPRRPVEAARERTAASRERSTLGTVAVGTAACFGLVVSSGIVAVIAAGSLQWLNLPNWLDNTIPVLVLLAGLLLSGRVATDVAGRQGVLCGLGTAVLVALVGTAVARAGEAHGDGIEPVQIAVATVVVAGLSAGNAWWVARRRTTR